MDIGSKPFIIAELSGNFAGDLAKGKEMIRVAARCGCDAVKIQTYEPADMDDPANNHIYEKYSLPRAWYPELFETAKENNIPHFSSVFASWAIEFLDQFDCPAYKIASPESTRLSYSSYTHLTRIIRNYGKTFIASSGRRDMGAINALCPDVLMYCVAGYSAQITDADIEYFTRLPTIGTHRGFSDHSNDIKTPLAMIAAGATIIEKHFKLDDDCIDAAFSFNPKQMETLCRIVHK